MTKFDVQEKAPAKPRPAPRWGIRRRAQFVHENAAGLVKVQPSCAANMPKIGDPVPGCPRRACLVAYTQAVRLEP